MSRLDKGTTKVGYVNRHGQVVIRKTDIPGSDNNSKVVQMGCSNCGYVYGANTGDVWERKCPREGGRPGEAAFVLTALSA